MTIFYILNTQIQNLLRLEDLQTWDNPVSESRYSQFVIFHYIQQWRSVLNMFIDTSIIKQFRPYL